MTSQNNQAIDIQSIKNAAETPIESHILDAFTSLLQSSDDSHAIQEAVTQINQLFPSGQSDDAEDFLWTLWSLLLEIVRKVPHHDTRQDVLVTLLEELRQRDLGTVEIWGNETHVWEDLPLLGPCLRENWIRPDDEIYPSSELSIAWFNLNSFTARLINAGLIQEFNFAIWELRAALEEESSNLQFTNRDISVASEWIIRSGRSLYKALSTKALDDKEARVTKAGSLYKGEPGLCPERWRFWKTRLDTVKASLDGEVPEVAQKALDTMDEIERMN